MAPEQLTLPPEGAAFSSLEWMCRFGPNEKLTKVVGAPVKTTYLSPQTAEWGLTGEGVSEMLNQIGVSARYLQPHAEALGIILKAMLAALKPNSSINGVFAVCLSRAASSFSTPPRYRTNRIGLKTWTRVIDSLERMGFIEKLCGGFKGEGYFQGLTSTYVPTQTTSDWFSEHSSGLSLAHLSANEPLLLTSNKRLIDYPDNEHTNALRRQIEDINTVNRAHHFGLQKGLEVISIDQRLLTGKRRFRDDFQSGGRMFLALQQLKKKERANLIIDGEKTVELDFSSHAPRMLFHANGRPAPSDCYAHASVPRQIMKEAMLRVTNCDTRSTALRSLTVLLRERGIDYFSPKELLTAVEETNPFAVKGMKPGRWKEIQFLESRIACGIAHQLHKHDVPCLPIHDSFVVRQRDRDTLMRAMHEEYRKQFPEFSPVVTEAG
ncbi:hypothetical protein BKP64_06395 [Marinobacter salinus]|uniref:Uncharacterized protein n=1 Tax=Marinobacter salinus TaxID=1874317 RepID=A0A1D9GJL7_9GAMM|nr:hypothetical protein [Marinobacter salinus]AOY87832.1 hypothetical protein BKP64_06395 [Marinobacter salinus]